MMQIKVSPWGQMVYVEVGTRRSVLLGCRHHTVSSLSTYDDSELSFRLKFPPKSRLTLACLEHQLSVVHGHICSCPFTPLGGDWPLRQVGCGLPSP